MSIGRMGKYQLFEVLGTGGMGEVYLARSQEAECISKLVALKKIRPDLTQNEKMKALFRSEALMAIRLDHSNIATVYELGVDRDTFYLVMEYVGGISLRDLMSRQMKGEIDLPPEVAIHLVLEIGKALSYAHRFVDPETQGAAPVVHQDVSPHNVLLNFEGEVKLIDFGVARMDATSQASTLSGVMGKVDYMSPEQAQGGIVDSTTDIFALGLLLWEMLSGKRYYEWDSLKTIHKKLLKGEPVKALDKKVVDHHKLNYILGKMLAPNSGSRYQTADAFLLALQEYYHTTHPKYSQAQLRRSLKKFFAQEHQAHLSRLQKHSYHTDEKLEKAG